MKKQESVYANTELFKLAEKLANKTKRSKSFYLTKWITEGALKDGLKKVEL